MIEIIVLIILIILSAFFSSSEIALASTTDATANSLKKKNPHIAWVKKHQEEVVIAILIGNNIVNMLAGSMATVILYKTFGDSAVAIATGIMTFLLLTFGEIIPKTIAIKLSHIYLDKTAYLLKLITYLLSPIISFYKKLMELLSKKIKVRAEKLYEEEIKYILQEGYSKGIINKYEKEMVEKIFKLDEYDLSQIMIPIEHAFMLPETLSTKEARKKIENITYNDILIFRTSHKKPTGIIHTTDIWKKDTKLSNIKRPFITAHKEEKPLLLLKRMKDTGIDFAVIFDNKKEAIGIITLDDLLEFIIKNL